MAGRISFAILASCFTLPFAASPAQAQNWVSSTGDNANNCTRTAPCRTFQGAHDDATPGETIYCVDAAIYGYVEITKSITIDCSGTHGAIHSATDGMIINGTGISVTLRNITIAASASPLGGVGIVISEAAFVDIENVVVRGFRANPGSAYGMVIRPSAGAMRVRMSNSQISEVGATGSGGAGIRMAPTGAAQVRLLLNNVELARNRRALEIDTSGTTAGNVVIITDSQVTGSIDNGITGTTSANALNIIIEGTTIAGNLRGIVVNGAGGRARIGSSVVVDNGPAFAVAGGASILSFRNNQIELNGNNGTPLPAATLQ